MLFFDIAWYRISLNVNEGKVYGIGCLPARVMDRVTTMLLFCLRLRSDFFLVLSYLSKPLKISNTTSSLYLYIDVLTHREMDDFETKKSMKARCLKEQKRWTKSMVGKLFLKESVDIKVHQEINHATHPCFCKGRSTSNKWNKFRNKKGYDQTGMQLTMANEKQLTTANAVDCGTLASRFEGPSAD